MTLQFHQTADTVLEVVARDKPSKQDCIAFIKAVEDRMAQCGQRRLLVDLRDFDGWDTETIWTDLKFDAGRVQHIDRIAVIGEKTWHERMTILFRPFTVEQVRCFVPEQAAQAHAWIEEEAHPSAAGS
jgi:hypothetical protein